MGKGRSGRKDSKKVWKNRLAGVAAVTLLLVAALYSADRLPVRGNGSRGPQAGINGVETRSDEAKGRSDEAKDGNDKEKDRKYGAKDRNDKEKDREYGMGDGDDGGGIRIGGISSQEEWARKQLEGMSLEEKAAQLFIITPEQLTGCGQVTQAGEVTREALDSIRLEALSIFPIIWRMPDS